MQECDRLKHCREGVRIGTTGGPIQALCVLWKGAHNSNLGDTFAITLVNGVGEKYDTDIRKYGRNAQIPRSAEQAAIFCPVGSNLQLSISACKSAFL